MTTRRSALRALKLCLLVAFALACSACLPPARAPANGPEWMRAGLVLAARGVLAAHAECALVAGAMRHKAEAADPLEAEAILGKAKVVIEECNAVSRDALDDLLAADELLDVRDAIDARQVGCAATKGLVAMRRMRELLLRFGRPMPAVVTQAIAFVGPLAELAGTCKPEPAAAQGRG